MKLDKPLTFVCVCVVTKNQKIYQNIIYDCYILIKLFCEVRKIDIHPSSVRFVSNS